MAVAASLLIQRVHLPAVALSAGEWVLWAIASVLLTALIALVVYLLLKKEKPAPLAKSTKESDGEAPLATVSVSELPQSFQGALHTMRDRRHGRDFRYASPWMLLLGPSGAGKSSLLSDSSLSNSLEEQVGIEHATGITWSFFGDGIVIDVGGWSLQPGTVHTSAWRRLLRLFVNNRPERPLDGLILAISAEDLYGPKALSAADLVERGAVIQQRLRQLAEVIGFHLPIFVILTKCDVLEGFVPFCNELSPEELEQIFGWSNPFGENLTFQSEWVDTAIHSIRVCVERVQSRLFALHEYSPQRESMFLFPGALHTLLPPLRLLLSRVLRGGDTPAPQLRGIYCTGSTDTSGTIMRREPDMIPVAMPGLSLANQEQMYEEEETALSWIPRTMEPWLRPGLQIGFVHDLFFRKIFPERNLGQPLRRHFTVRDRLRVSLQIATATVALVLGISTAVSYHRLMRDRTHLLSLLYQIDVDLRTNPDYSHYAHQVDTHPGARELVQTIANYQGGALRSPVMPASWFSSMPEDVNQAMVDSFSKLVLTRFHDALEARAKDLADPAITPLNTPDPRRSSSDLPPGTQLTQSPDYLQLQTFTQDLHALDQNIALYNQVCVPGDHSPLEAIIQLDEYLHNRTDRVKLSEFSRSFFQKAINDASYKCFDYSPDQRNMMTAKAEKLIENLDSSWLTNNPTRVVTEKLVSDFNQLSQPASVGLLDVNRIGNDLRAAQTVYSAPELHWVGADELQVPADLAAVTSGMANTSPFLDPSLARWITATQEMDLSLLNTSLEQTQTALTGPVVENDAGQLTLSKGSLEVQTALNALGKSAFFINPSQPVDRPLENSPGELAWDKSALEAATALPVSYGKFVTDQLNNDTAPVRQVIASIAAKAVSVSVENSIFDAERPSTSMGNPIGKAQSFNESEPALVTLLGMLAQYRLSGPREHLRSIATRQAAAILSELDAQLNREAPYGIPATTFTSWTTGEPSASLLTAGTPDEIAAWVTAQQDQISALYAAADPLVRFLQSNGTWAGDAAMLARWQGISAALAAYAAKKPANSVQRLNEFVLTGMDKVQPATGCALPAGKQITGTDYFVTAASTLKHNLVLRCQELLSGSFEAAYIRLADAFNRNLSERFPFAPLSSPSSAEADPAAVQRVLQLHDMSADLLRSPKALTSPIGVQTFLAGMDSVHPWFESLLSTTGNGAMALDVAPEFRVQRDLEVNGNQIIDWTLQVGASSLHASDPPKKLQWHTGDPVSLTLRWAKDAALMPAHGNSYGGNEGGYTVNGDTVSWRWADTWSLLRFLRQFQIPDPSAKPQKQGGGQAFLLQFEVPEVASSPTAAHQQAPATARVFLRLTLSSSGSTTPLAAPNFPRTAPPLTAKSGSNAQEEP